MINEIVHEISRIFIDNIILFRNKVHFHKEMANPNHGFLLNRMEKIVIYRQNWNFWDSVLFCSANNYLKLTSNILLNLNSDEILTVPPPFCYFKNVSNF